jgi:hypothetical protein
MNDMALEGRFAVAMSGGLTNCDVSRLSIATFRAASTRPETMPAPSTWRAHSFRTKRARRIQKWPRDSACGPISAMTYFLSLTARCDEPAVHRDHQDSLECLLEHSQGQLMNGIGMLAQAIGSHDMVEGARAYLEKRAPRFEPLFQVPLLEIAGSRMSSTRSIAGSTSSSSKRAGSRTDRATALFPSPDLVRRWSD